MNNQLLDEAGRDGTRRDETRSRFHDYCITLHKTHAKDTQIQCNIYFHLKTKILFK
jgi:hypothetical protein